LPEQKLSPLIWNILACPHCSIPLERKNDGAFCPSCGSLFTSTDSGALDLRPQKRLSRLISFTVNTSAFPSDPSVFGPLTENREPEVGFSGTRVPYHLSREFMSWFPKAQTRESLAMDLGCGDGVHREFCESCGFEYVGLDYNSEQASILGNAHALPFKDNSFEFILSVAVLEHIRYPFLMAAEVGRVLRPGGKFIGTAAFLEPFHGDSYYHHSHLGLLNTLLSGGFKVERISPVRNWTGLTALGQMGLFPRMPAILTRAILAPLYLAQRAWWGAARLITRHDPGTDRTFRNAGAFVFIAVKE